MNKWTLLIAAIGLASTLYGQAVPTPGTHSPNPVLLKNGIIHPGKGAPARQGDLMFSEGKIKAVGVVGEVPPSAQVIDLKGAHVYPGLIACNSHLGLEEVESVRATIDAAEVGDLNPNVRALVAFNTDSKVTPTVRSNGILIAQVAPRGGVMAGLSSVVQLDAWNWEQAAYVADDALHVFWPEMRIATHRWAPPAEEQKKRIAESLEALNTAAKDAKAYQAAKKSGLLKEHDMRWEAMEPFLKGEKPLWIHASSEKQIRSAVAYCLEHGFNMVLAGGQDAIHCVDLLKEHNIPVVLFPPHNLPTNEESDVDQPFKTAAQLFRAGLKVAISQDGFWQQRNLPFLAGTTAAHGLTPEEALALITSTPAEILGISGRTGALEVGMDANLIVSRGDLLDMRSSEVTHAWIQGRPLDLGNHQKDLYAKFSKRP